MAAPPSPTELQRQLISFAAERQRRAMRSLEVGSVSDASTTASTRRQETQLGARWRRNVGPLTYEPMGTSQVAAEDDWRRPVRIKQRDAKALATHEKRNRFARRGAAEVAVFAGERAIQDWGHFQKAKIRRAERVYQHMVGATLGGVDPNASAYSRQPTGEPGARGAGGARHGRRMRRASNAALRDPEEIEKLVSMKYL
jgi:hypothetical protein